MPRRRFSNGAVDILKDIIETLDTESTTLEQSSPQVPIQHTFAQSNQPAQFTTLLRVPNQHKKSLSPGNSLAQRILSPSTPFA